MLTFVEVGTLGPHKLILATVNLPNALARGVSITLPS